MTRVYLALAAVMSGIAVVSVGNGLLAVFLAVRMTVEQFPTVTIGVVVTGYSAGFLVGCLLVGRAIRRVGHIRSFAVFAGLMATASLAFAVHVHPLSWLALRLVTGFAAAGLFVVAESWLTEKVPSAQRGRVFGVYMISNKIAYGCGQLLLMAGDPAGLALFMIASACFSLCLLPVALTRAESPGVPDLAGFGLRDLYRVSPVAVVGCFIAGVNNNSVVGVGPVYAAGLGLGTGEIAWFTALVQFGSLLLQYPIGRLSDVIDRRRVLVIAGAGTVLLALLIMALGERSTPGLLALAALYGGISFTLYPLCVAHAADHVEARHLVAVSGGLLLAWAAGATIGPVLATLIMAQAGPGGLFLFVALATSLLILFTLWRMTRRPPPPSSEPAPFVPAPEMKPQGAAGGAEAASPSG
jgi:MFS family permease